MTDVTTASTQLADLLSRQLGEGGDYLGRLRSALALLLQHFGASTAGIRLYNGSSTEIVTTVVFPEARTAADVDALCSAAAERRTPIVHRPDRQTRFGVLSLPDFPALALPVLRSNRLIAVVALVRHRGMAYDLADLAELDTCLPLLQGTIEDALAERTLLNNYLRSIEALTLALEAKDPYTRGHCNMVAAYATAIAETMQLPHDEVETIALGAILHDLGKVGIPDHILSKPGPLTPEEFDLMKLHPEIGEGILKPLDSPLLDKPRQIVRWHHERLDGRGYPDGLVAAEIPLMVRIVTVADAWDAMTSDRPYRAGLAPHIAAREMLHRSGDMWDPEVVRVHLGLVYPEALAWTREPAVILNAA
ncbi:MAG: HD-GYP domain-containing protein, partial [bacterium]